MRLTPIHPPRQARRPKGAQTILLVSACFVAPVVLAAVLAFTTDLNASATVLVLLAALLLCLAFVPIVSGIVTRNFDLLNPKYLFAANYALSLGIYPLYSVFSGNSQLPGWYFAAPDKFNTYLNVMILAIGGLICYYLGYQSGIAKSIVARARKLPRLDPPVLRLISKVYVLVGALAAFLFLWKYGGLSQFLLSRDSWRSSVSGDGPLVFALGTLLPTAALLRMLLRSSTVRRGIDLLGWLFLGLCLVPALILGFRILIVPPILQAIAIGHYRVRRVSASKLIVAAVILLATLSAYGLIRDSGANSVWGWTTAELGRNLVARSPGTEVAAVVVESTEVKDYEYGLPSLVEFLTIVVPRQIWSDKPLSWGEHFSTRWFGPYFQMRDSTAREYYGGVSPTPVAYFYIQGGWLGVIVGMLGMGVITRVLYEYGRKQTYNISGFLLYLFLLPSLVIAAETPQGALNGAAIGLLIGWFPIALLGHRGGLSRSVQSGPPVRPSVRLADGAMSDIPELSTKS